MSRTRRKMQIQNRKVPKPMRIKGIGTAGKSTQMDKLVLPDVKKRLRTF